METQIPPSEQITKMLPLVKAGAHFVIARSHDKKPIWPEPHGSGWEKKSPKMPTLYKYGKQANIVFGIVPASIGFVVVDVDTDHRIDAGVLRNEVAESIGEPIFETKTRSGGYHMFYRSPFHKRKKDTIRNSEWYYPPENKEDKGGEIRGSNGFVVMWSVDAILAGLEGINDHDPVDLTKWPFKQHQATPEQPAKQIKHTPMPPDELKEMLSHIDANAVPYEKWVRVGMALHSGGYDLSVWEEWSRDRDPNMHRNSAPQCRGKWSSFSGDGVSMGTLWNMAQDGGWTPPRNNSDGQPQWGGARPGSGRPETENPSYKTQRNRKSKLRTEMIDWAHENDLVVYHQFDSPVYNDAWRILRFENDLLLVVDGKMHVANGPVWRLLSPLDDVSMNTLSLLLQKARLQSIETLPDHVPEKYGDHILDYPMDYRHLREIANTLKVYVDKVTNIPTQYFNDRDRNPVIPFNNGECLHLKKQIMLDKEDARALHMRDCDWNIPYEVEVEPPKKAQEIIFRQYGEDIIDRIAIWFTGTDKTCDVSRFRSDGGKTTLYDLLSRAFPGAFAKRNATQALNFSAQRFTPMSPPLVNCVGVFLDEATHSDAQISASVLNAWDSDELEVEEKYEKRIVAKRIGNLMLLGSDEWPHVDSSAQGFEARFKWVCDRMETEKMTSAERSIVLADTSVKWFRGYILKRAQELFAAHNEAWRARKYQEDKAHIKRDLAAFEEATQNPLVAALKELYEKTDAIAAFVSCKEIVLELEDYLPKKAIPAENKLVLPMRKALNDNSLTTMKRSAADENGKRPRGFRDVRRRLDI